MRATGSSSGADESETADSEPAGEPFQRALHGGLAEGVDIIEVDNGYIVIRRIQDLEKLAGAVVY